MKWTYDADADALYITFREAAVSRTVEVDRGTLVDLDWRGSAVGLEILHPGRDWPLEALAELGCLDSATLEDLRRTGRTDRDPRGPFKFAGAGTLAATR